MYFFKTYFIDSVYRCKSVEYVRVCNIDIICLYSMEILFFSNVTYVIILVT